MIEWIHSFQFIICDEENGPLIHFWAARCVTPPVIPTPEERTLFGPEDE